jgi:oxaloacetate decarboxylase gamma subunit
MTESLIDQGLELLVFGMGTVLVFLTLLVIAIGVMSALLGRYFPELEEPVKPPLRPTVKTIENPDLVAVISAAVHRYRSRK